MGSTEPNPEAGSEHPTAAAGGAAPTDEVLDATVSAGDAAPDFSPAFFSPYDPRKFTDQARKYITFWLLGLLTLLFIGAFVSLFMIEDKPTFDHLKGVLEMLLGPLVALVSAATGFYFGAQSAKKKDEP